jgi:hypothetical protein
MEHPGPADPSLFLTVRTAVPGYFVTDPPLRIIRIFVVSGHYGHK